MIYIVLFIYYVFLALLYDVGRYRRYRRLHFFVSLALMILVSGLRYRVGSDTVVYMDDFKYYPDLFHLRWNDFSDVRYEPFWILLNVCCKTLCNDFFLVQCVISMIHIVIWGKFVKKVCPTLCFSMVLFYYMFEFTKQNMEVMREAVALAFFLLAILALDERKTWKVMLYVITAFLFHKFSLVVFGLFFGFYLVYSLKKIYVLPVIAFFIIMPIVQRDWIYTIIENILSLDTIFTKGLIFYATSDQYTMIEYNWKGVLVTFLAIYIYIFMVIRCKHIFSEYIKISNNIFESTIYFSAILISVKFSFMIFYRLYDYFQSFTSLLVIICFMECVKKMDVKQRIVLCFFSLLIPVYFCYKSYAVPFANNPNATQRYMIYYPYSSVFYPKEDLRRELLIFNYKL